ncbi:hypothetical protein EMIT0210MI2_11323 [Priestia megaterium]
MRFKYSSIDFSHGHRHQTFLKINTQFKFIRALMREFIEIDV